MLAWKIADSVTKTAKWPIDDLIASDVDTINDGFSGWACSFKPYKL